MTMRRIAAISLTCLLLAACGDDRGSDVPDGPAYDLGFAGEVAGTQVLMRTRGDARRVEGIRLGIPGTGVAAHPSEDRLVFTSLGNSTELPKLMVLDRELGGPTPYADAPNGYEREADWHPAGGRIAFTSMRDDAYGDIFTATVTPSRMTAVANLTGANGGAGVAEMTPAWSPDGSRIAFTSYRGGNPSIWIMNADGSEPRQLSDEGQWGDYFPTWSPAGDSIAFQRISNQDARIGLVAASGGTPRFLTLAGDGYGPAWAPDAPARLAISMRVAGDDIDIHVVKTDGTILERIARPEGRDFQPQWIRSSARF